MLAEVFIGLDEGLEVGPDAGNAYLIGLDAGNGYLIGPDAGNAYC